ncbi:hypothetical protein GGR56DRAFT_302268 [Xylariaceae sp. FL0804]|nr:hypothetical protein GGR56DRAFT_302268 [Xylariaceae sp. FL0804]
MEQSASVGTPRTVPPQTRRRPSLADPSVPHLANSEPGISNIPHDDLANSIPSLRFPFPLGNRQLTNWVSSSSPDIMQPGHTPDEEPSLAELGYDIIGTDGESQAESIASSFDYQRPDDVQSLAGTDIGTDGDTNDVDTDMSDEEENTHYDNTLSHHVAAQDGSVNLSDVDVETLVNQSLEHPTSLSQPGSSPFHPLTLDEQAPARELLAAMRDFSPPVRDAGCSEAAETKQSRTHESKQTPSRLDRENSAYVEIHRWAFKQVRAKRRILFILSGLAVLYSLVIAGKSLLTTSTVARELSTVPVASVSSVGAPNSPPTVSVCTRGLSSTEPLSTTTSIQKALQTQNADESLVLSGKGKAPRASANTSLQRSLCSAEVHGHNGIMVRIPEALKNAWLSRDAIMLAVSRGSKDVPTKVSSVPDGFLIEVPPRDAYGVLSVSIATISKPKITETYRINFGKNYMFTEAFDAGKLLVREFAQRVVNTVNDTTTWVEDTYIPAFDGMSKQVRDQTASVSDSLLQAFRDAGDTVRSVPSRITSGATSYFKQSMDRGMLAQRADQAQLELSRQAHDMLDELSMVMLTGRLNSKLLWLKMQGKMDEYKRYRGKAEVYWRDQRVDADLARHERAERVKRQIHAQRKQERRGATGTFWHKAAGVP